MGSMHAHPENILATISLKIEIWLVGSDDSEFSFLHWSLLWGTVVYFFRGVEFCF